MKEKKWGVKAGLRVENTDLKTYLVNTEENQRSELYQFFPTLHSSYKINQRISCSGGVLQTYLLSEIMGFLNYFLTSEIISASAWEILTCCRNLPTRMRGN
ncbi:MAG: outer membrane beta-barrel protein [Saprospiraceae bacterium]